MKVKLISYTKDPLYTIYSAYKQCYSKEISSSVSSLKEMESFIERVFTESGHLSPLEHVSFTFAISGISRVCSHQLVRHRIASYSQKSQRYVKESNFDYIVPETIISNVEALSSYCKIMEEIDRTYSKLVALGVPKEDARFVLPNAIETSLTMSMNARSLINFLELRLCTRAQWEIRLLAEKIHAILIEVLPCVFSHVGPQCKRLGYCPEKTSCGLSLSRRQIIEKEL